MPIFDNKYILINIPGTYCDTISDLFNKHLDSFLIGKDKQGRCLDHLSMDDIKINTRIDSSSIYNYFTISFVRNPYERLVHCYLEFKEKQSKNKIILGPKNFKQFVDWVSNIVSKKLYDNKLGNDYYFAMPQTEMIGESELDFIGRCELIDNSIKLLSKYKGFKFLKKLKIQTKKIEYKSYYTPEIKNIVDKLYLQDLIRFGYVY
tara:strand:- start:343 stop:957 length:615 start_codon:yes stop_codon:yes gene_type:complete